MKRRTFVTSFAAGGALAVRPPLATRANPDTPTAAKGIALATNDPATGYAPINGLQMYYEIHGDASDGRPPLLLLHGAYATIGLWGELLLTLAASRRVIAVEQQGHGHTADIDRPLTFEQMADDSAALLAYLGVDQVDVLGYSLGGQIALQIAIRHPELVRKLVVVSAPVRQDGWYPEVIAASSTITAELFAGTPIETEYRRVAPNPDGLANLVAKLTRLAGVAYGSSEDAIRAIPAPTMVVVGDADGVRLEHAVEMVRLRGGGVAGDFVGLPPSRLAVLPGTTHVGIVGERAGWLGSMTTEFLDAP